MTEIVILLYYLRAMPGTFLQLKLARLKESLDKKWIAVNGLISPERAEAMRKDRDHQAWLSRLAKIENSPFFDRIPRHPDAGKTVDGHQIMHNGILIVDGSYYGSFYGELLKKTRGVHEPLEEWIFQSILPLLPPQSTMMELGAYWGFYSLWFCRTVPQARAFLFEPDPNNLEFGKKNFALNGLHGEFRLAWVDKQSGKGPEGQEIVCVDDLMEELSISDLAILHADIQSTEFKMLLGTEKSLAAKRIQFVFISTHGYALHQNCLKLLKKHGYHILASAPPHLSDSHDGLIVASRPGALRTEPFPGAILSS